MVNKRRKIKRIIERFKEELKKLGIHPGRIILYGSYAKGSPKEESDIDLIIISDDFKNLNFRERLELLGIAAGRVFEPIEALGYTEEEIKEQEEGSFIGEIFNSGAVTY